MQFLNRPFSLIVPSILSYFPPGFSCGFRFTSRRIFKIILLFWRYISSVPYSQQRNVQDKSKEFYPIACPGFDIEIKRRVLFVLLFGFCCSWSHGQLEYGGGLGSFSTLVCSLLCLHTICCVLIHDWKPRRFRSAHLSVVRVFLAKFSLYFWTDFNPFYVVVVFCLSVSAQATVLDLFSFEGRLAD